MIGETVADRYEVKEKLASGRFLSTYRGVDTALGNAVSLDILEAEALPGDLSADRLEEILDAALAVRGGHIACLFDWGRVGEDGPFFMAREMVEGSSLLDIMDDCGELPPEQAVEIARAAVDALAEAYGRGLFYLGLNPGQVVIDGRGDVKLIRVGFGWILEESEPLLSRRVSPYRAPETEGGMEGRRTSDVYALAAMIRGMLPSHAASGRLARLLDTAMDPLPGNRPSSPRLVLEELEKSAMGAGSPRGGFEVGETMGGGAGLSFLKEGTIGASSFVPKGKKRGRVLRNLLLITGDPPKMGPYPEATAVFDIDSIGLANLVARLNRGLDPGGNPIGEPTAFTIGVGVNPGAVDREHELNRFYWKVDAGAEYARTATVKEAGAGEGAQG